jgi:uncharacterized protein
MLRVVSEPVTDNPQLLNNHIPLMLSEANYWIEKLKLQPHPEGGFYKETYRSEGTTEVGEEGKIRHHSTAIYFLLLENKFSAFHRIQSDELWHFYAGSCINIFFIDHEENLQTIRLGSNTEAGEQFQAVVPAHCWFAARMVQPYSYALVGCTVAPGFDFKDFEMAERKNLIRQYPQHAQIITSLTYES